MAAVRSAFKASSIVFFSRSSFRIAGLNFRGTGRVRSERAAFFNSQIVQQSVGAGGIGYLFFDRQRFGGIGAVSGFRPAVCAIQLRLRSLVEIGTEFERKPRDCGTGQGRAAKRPPPAAWLDLSGTTHPAHRKTLRSRRGRMFELNRSASKINLVRRDGNNVGWNVRGNVARLGFDERQRSERTAASGIAQLRGALRAGGCADRTRHREPPRVGGQRRQQRSDPRGRRRRASKDRRICTARGGPLSRKNSPMAQPE